ncbi:tRNA pseudouridine(55) synthase TruB [Notoacmeibacter ruber]|uniref:tRNA pseudouridine synthase B n=1 Tax=Notoacmeibacter ruber TaxID=2670375 RepID=A0A3L7JEU0_9HYPH|nr:tRNA pseudouridine(55) synthase TruB [Notoacmeibacter ruber]RLQ86992.1 tRNA pseudouridine(55) synthase TruB [Notoacmeibacter ruber]
MSNENRNRRGGKPRGKGPRQKKRGRPVSGWVILDKPFGMGSTEAVAKIKWLFNAEKAGHAGTLDPLASGMLPIALGEATKTVPFVMDGIKVYRFTVSWGEERSTDDLEGEVTDRSDKRPTREEVEAILPDYRGVIMQVPPQFSAIKIDGERAYNVARGGDEVEIPAREVEIDQLEIIDMDEAAGTTVLEVECGKGTYVRSLARDMGRQLGCFGHISELRRVEVAPFVEDDLVTLDELEAARGEGDKAVEAVVAEDDAARERGEEPAERPRVDRFAALDKLLIETAAALEDLPHVALNDDAASRVRLGNSVIIRGRDAPTEADEAFVTNRGRLVALGVIAAGQFQPKRVFTHS